jgi:mannosyl-3-phosphoglycerate phosphatase
MPDAPLASSLLVVTDLDGTLLDETTYSFEAARPALTALKAARVPLVIATSKTRAEVDRLAAALDLHPILIVENGGALIIPAELLGGPDAAASFDDDLVVELGTPREVLVDRLADIGRETGAAVRGFHQMSLTEVRDLTGLSSEDAELARDRHYDEPFVADEDRMPAIVEAASRRGLSVSRGGRFYHLSGQVDKGTAFRAILERLSQRGLRYRSVGLGDAPNDLPFLQMVDRAILMPRAGGTVHSDLVRALPHADRARCPGALGWNDAVLTVLRGNAGARKPN